MNLTVHPRQNSAMFTVVHSPPYEQFPGGKRRQDSILYWERIEPKHHEIDEFDFHTAGDMLKWQSRKQTPRPLLDCSDGPLRFANVYLGCRRITFYAGN